MSLPRVKVAGFVLAVCGTLLCASARAQSTEGGSVKDVKFEQKLGDLVPLDRVFRDDTGREVPLKEFFGRRPVVIVPVFYRCPLLCNQLLNGFTRTLKPVKLLPGKDFEVVIFSIDPEENPDLAAAKKANYLKQYGRQETASGWHFLTSSQDSIDALTKAIGFQYTFNPRTHLFTHAAGVVVATADGRIARYFFGIDFPPRELEEEIERAGGGKIGSPIGRLLLLCYDYDAATGKYTLSIVRILRIFGSATAIALFSYLAVMFRRDSRGAASRATALAPHHHP